MQPPERDGRDWLDSSARGERQARRETAEQLRERVRRLERRLAEAAVVRDAHRRLARSLSVDGVAAVALEMGQELTGAERCRLAMPAPGGRWRCWERAIGATVQQYEVRADAAFPAEVVRGAGSRLIPDLASASPEPDAPEMVRRASPRSYMAVPLSSGERVVGLLELADLTFPAHMEEYADTLGAVLIPAALALDNAALYERAEQARLRTEEYVHIISHDLRNPLMAVQGHAQIVQRALERAGLSGQVLASAGAVVTSAQRMSLMIRDLVESSRLETGQVGLAPEPLSLRRLVLDLRERMAGALDVERIAVEVPESLPPVVADPPRLERILTNLLSNALAYSAPDSEVLIAARKVDEEEAAVSVVDRGVGIAPEDLPHIFERFYRSKGPQRGEGLGLGLYITRGLVEAHGGRIWAESRPGQGSTFTFTLPLAR